MLQIKSIASDVDLSPMNDLSKTLKIPRFMGILNLTEDSFSDGALYLDPHDALIHADKLIAEGAEIIDIGAESTRPGAVPVPIETELERIIPVLKAIKSRHPQICCSIDTRKAEVARRCIDLGAEIINDISALSYDPEMMNLLRDHPQVKVILMHMQGTPETMQHNPHYTDVIQEIQMYFTELISSCVKRGIQLKNIMIDPGIGFGKNLQHNLALLANLQALYAPEVPIVLGASRKSFINELHPSEPMQRLGGSLAATAWAIMKQVEIVRVHDVAAHLQFAKVFIAIAQEEMFASCLF